VGDITYYAPWGNLAIFYRDFDYSRGLVRLGRIDSGIEALAATSGEVTVRGAMNTGCTREEIRETLLQEAVYCGSTRRSTRSEARRPSSTTDQHGRHRRQGKAPARLLTGARCHELPAEVA